jgi:polysaccharide biosynthesis transport protein
MKQHGMVSAPQEPVVRRLLPAAAADHDWPLSELLTILRRRRRVIVSVIVLMTGLVTLYGLQLEPTYTAKATVVVEPGTSQIVDVEQVQPGLSTDNASLETQVAVLQSRDLIMETILELDLLSESDFASVDADGELPGDSKLGQAVRELLGMAKERVAAGFQDGLAAIGLAQAEQEVEFEPGISVGIPAEEAIEESIDMFAWNLSVERSGEGNVLSVSYTSPDPAEAARNANAHASAYVESQLRGKRQATQEANAWLSERLQSLQQEVLEAEQAVTRFQAGNMISAEGTVLSEAELADLSGRLIDTRAAITETEARLRQIRALERSGKNLDAISEVVASSEIARLRGQESDLARDEAELATIYGERHPLMQALQQERAKLTARIKDEVDRIIRSLESELSVMEAREQGLAEALGAVRSENALENEAAVRLRELEREAAARRSLYETFLLRHQETKAQEGLLKADARIVSWAQIPEEPSTPSPKIFAAVGFTASSVFGCMVALLMEQLDKSLRSRRQVERILRLPCLALVPEAIGWKRGSRPHSLMLAQPRSAYAESIRALYMALFAPHGNRRSQTVLVTSALPGEGKSTLASSLAVLTSQRGKRTVLVDLDLRHPSVAHQFGLKPACGLVEMVSEQRNLAEVLLRDEATGVHVIPILARPSDPMSLIDSPRLRLLLRSLREQYDCVLLDAPPLLGMTDAPVLARYADATLLVIQWERTKQDAAVAALTALKDGSDTAAAAVLTRVNLKKHARYHYGDAGQFYSKYRGYYVN